MNWFYRLHKRAWEDDNDNLEDYLRQSLPGPKWMEMLPNRQRYWQVSLSKAMQRGAQEWGPNWNKSSFEYGSPHDTKQQVFFKWLERVPTSLIFHIKPQMDDFVEQNWGFRPFETEAPERTDVRIPSANELEDMFG